MTREDWAAVADERAAPQQPYCLCYFLGRTKESWERAVYIARSKGLRTVIIPVFNGDIHRGVNVPNDIGPRQFLGLISRASYVCTDSFHGLVFATLFEREFTVFERFKTGSVLSQNVRIENYLETIGLKRRLSQRGSAQYEMEERAIDYVDVHRRVAAQRASSLDYLRTALGI